MKDMLSPEHFDRVWSRVVPWDHGEAADCRENCHPEENSCPYHDDPRFRKCVFLAERREEERLLLAGLNRCRSCELRRFICQARHRMERLRCAICRISGECYTVDCSPFAASWYRCPKRELKWLNEQLFHAYSEAAGDWLWERERSLLHELAEEHRQLEKVLRQEG